MKNKELVSIIITTYSRPSYLERAINSVLKQTYTPIEIIVVDDNNANSQNRKLTEKLISKYKSIIYIKHEKNSGANVARNNGIKNSSGKYVAFLDDDDEFLPQKLSKLVDVAEKNMNKCGVLVFSSYNVIGNELLQKSKWSLNVNDDLFFPDVKSIYEGNYIGSNSFILVDKKSLESIEGYDVDLQSSQDWDLYLRLVNFGVKFIGVNEELVNYYSNMDEVRITNNKTKRLEGFNAINEKHKQSINKLDKNTKFKYFNYMYRRTVLLNFFRGLKFFPYILINLSSIKGVLIIFVDMIYPFLYSLRNILISVKKNRT